MNWKVVLTRRDLGLLLIGAVIGGWASGPGTVHATQAPPVTAEGCGEWVLQSRQAGGTKDYNAFLLNTRTGEVFFFKDENRYKVADK
jgi:hypothetical protein